MTSPEQVIAKTKQWITKVVIGCNFCPFAAKEVKQNSVHYCVLNNATLKTVLQQLIEEYERLDDDTAIETSFIILQGSFTEFGDYLNLITTAEKLLRKQGYDGIYQLASFHPLYIFAGSNEDDAANFTNRSVYPMLHILREESIEKALKNYPGADEIYKRNINFATTKGHAYMKMLRDTCL